MSLGGAGQKHQGGLKLQILLHSNQSIIFWICAPVWFWRNALTPKHLPLPFKIKVNVLMCESTQEVWDKFMFTVPSGLLSKQRRIFCKRNHEKFELFPNIYCSEFVVQLWVKCKKIQDVRCFFCFFMSVFVLMRYMSHSQNNKYWSFVNNAV